MKKMFKPKTWLFPRPVMLVSSSAGGRDNIVTLSWGGIACSEPPMLTIAVRKSRFSHKLIMESKEFVVNMPTSKQENIAEFCGTQTGSEVDKFTALTLTKKKASKVGAPLIAECPVNLECKVSKILELGSHDLFIAEIVAAHADDNILKAFDELDDSKLDTLAWQSPNYFRLMPVIKG